MTTIPLRSSHSAMALRVGHEVVLLDAGNYPGEANYLNMTYTWNGSVWTQVSSNQIDTSGPLPLRTDMGMSYDGTNVIIFGGRGESETSGLLQDTWSWSGSAWSKLAPATVPFGRCKHEMAYLSGTGTVMFGGSNVLNYLNETWVWNGTTWAQSSPTHSPPVRINHAMAASAALVLLFGGAGTNSCLNDVWTFNGTDWTQLSPTTVPSVRADASMAYDTANSKFVLFGGKNESGLVSAETWTSTNGSSWTKEAPTASPSARVGAQMSYDGTNVVLLGGNGLTDAFADMWKWDGSAKNWVNIF